MIDVLAVLGVALASLALGYAAGRSSVRSAVREAVVSSPLAAWVPRAETVLANGRRIVWGAHDHRPMYPLAPGATTRCRCGGVFVEDVWYSPETYVHMAMQAALLRATEAAGVQFTTALIEYEDDAPDDRDIQTVCVACSMQLRPSESWADHEATPEHIAASAWRNG